MGILDMLSVPGCCLSAQGDVSPQPSSGRLRQAVAFAISDVEVLVECLLKLHSFRNERKQQNVSELHSCTPMYAEVLQQMVANGERGTSISGLSDKVSKAVLSRVLSDPCFCTGSSGARVSAVRSGNSNAGRSGLTAASFVWVPSVAMAWDAANMRSENIIADQHEVSPVDSSEDPKACQSAMEALLADVKKAVIPGYNPQTCRE